MRFFDFVRAAALTVFIVAAAATFLLANWRPGSFLTTHFYEILGFILLICIAAAVYDLVKGSKPSMPRPHQPAATRKQILGARRKLKLIAAIVIVITALVFIQKILVLTGPE